MSNAFLRLWLATDTAIDRLTPSQRRRIRRLCQRFYEAGRKHAEEKRPAAPNKIG